MKKLIVTGWTMETKERLHAAFAARLSFPACYGANLDALYDCLTDVHEETAIEWFQTDRMTEYAGKAERVLLRAAEENPCLRLRLYRLRPERPGDFETVEQVTREAFWNHYAPGCSEHYLAHVMRGDPAFVKDLDLVADLGGQVVGNAMYADAKILLDEGGEQPALCLGPVSVLPEFQGCGVGSALILETLERARELGYSSVLLYGDPAYYGRFGFLPAETYGIGTADDQYAAALLALELRECALAGAQGRFSEASVYAVDEDCAMDFDKRFPKKARLSGGASQERFLELLGQRKPRK